MHLFKSDFRFWFNHAEINQINDNNEQYQLRSPEEELLLTWFEPCKKEDANAFLNASQILAKLSDKAKINVSDRSVNKLGKALVKHKFQRLWRHGSLMYALREFTWEEVDLKNRIIEDDNQQEKQLVNIPEVAQSSEIQGDLPF